MKRREIIKGGLIFTVAMPFISAYKGINKNNFSESKKSIK